MFKSWFLTEEKTADAVDVSVEVADVEKTYRVSKTKVAIATVPFIAAGVVALTVSTTYALIIAAAAVALILLLEIGNQLYQWRKETKLQRAIRKAKESADDFGETVAQEFNRTAKAAKEELKGDSSGTGIKGAQPA